MGSKPPTPSFERLFITALTGDTSGYVINLNMNTAFKMLISYPRKSAVFADSSRALCRCTLLFCSLFNSPSKASSRCPVRHALTPWATRVGQQPGIFYVQKSTPNKGESKWIPDRACLSVIKSDWVQNWFNCYANYRSIVPSLPTIGQRSDQTPFENRGFNWFPRGRKLN